jgi:mono/diheme cytochrome c family protein
MRIKSVLLSLAGAGLLCAAAFGADSADQMPANPDVPPGGRPPAAVTAAATTVATPMGTLSRGAYLARAGDCIACHTGPGAAQYSGGLPMNSPFGIIYTSNITPDPQTGIGRYSRDDFARALRNGVRRDGTRLYPAMPFASYAALTDADITDLYAYFMREVTPVKRVPPQTDLPFPFNQRWAMYFWDAAFVKHAVYQAKPDRDLSWNRGAYLVQTLGHCGSCHTPRGPGYEERGYDESAPAFLSGGLVDNWYAANLTGARADGLGRRSEADIAQFLRSGHASGDTAFGSMREVVEKSTQYMTDDDLAAIAHYLKSLPARNEQASYRPGMVSIATQATRETVIAAPTLAIYRERPGAGVYSGFCAKCHGADGAGKAGKFPALAGNPAVLLPDPSSLIRLLVEGGAAPHTAQAPKPEKMPAFDSRIGDRDMADVLSYIRNSWGNKAEPVSVRTVTRLHAKVRKEDIKLGPAARQ